LQLHEFDDHKSHDAVKHQVHICVAIRNPEWHVSRASLHGSKQQ